MDEAGEVDGAPIVASGEAPEMLEAAEAPLDLIAMLVDGFVMGDEDLAIALGRITAWTFMPAISSRKSLLP
ncbi:MAG: hypothetical protein ABIO86_03635 [Sphingomonas sp.]